MFATRMCRGCGKYVIAGKRCPCGVQNWWSCHSSIAHPLHHSFCYSNLEKRLLLVICRDCRLCFRHQYAIFAAVVVMSLQERYVLRAMSGVLRLGKRRWREKVFWEFFSWSPSPWCVVDAGEWMDEDDRVLDVDVLWRFAGFWFCFSLLCFSILSCLRFTLSLSAKTCILQCLVLTLLGSCVL